MDKNDRGKDAATKEYDMLIERTLGVVVACKIYPKVLTQSEHKELYPFFDRNLFNALNQLDLIIGLKYLDLSHGVGNKSESRYFARVVATTSYEILKDLNQVMGKELRNFVIEKKGEDFLNEINLTVSKLNVLKKANQNMLKEIRHNLFGHKMDNGLHQAEKIWGLDVQKIYRIGRSVFDIQIKLLGQMTKLITEI